MKSIENKAMNTQLVNNTNDKCLLQTADGSWTIHIPEVEETYHSRHGAMQESMHVFIHQGLHHCSAEPISVLEVGLGTGLNVILTYLNTQKSIDYHGIEPYPMDKKLVEELMAKSESYAQLYRYIHFSPSQEVISLGDHFTLKKHPIKLLDFETEKLFDIIYFDAFGPDKQPVLWQPDNLTKLYLCLNNGGIWVTYASKGEVKRNLKQIGFDVQRLPGPPMKRHMLSTKYLEVLDFAIFMMKSNLIKVLIASLMLYLVRILYFREAIELFEQSLPSEYKKMFVDPQMGKDFSD